MSVNNKNHKLIFGVAPISSDNSKAPGVFITHLKNVVNQLMDITMLPQGCT